MSNIRLLNGDCLVKLQELDDNSVDSIVTDPPYGIDFMGKKWDYDVPSTAIWEQCFRVLKPGGYLLAFAGTRTQHRMAVRIEDAGFEIRDMIAWVYGSGFPKSHNISKAIDAKILTGKSNSVSLSKNEKNRPVVGMVERVVSKNRLASEGESESGVKKNRERFHDTETQEIPVTSSITDDAKKWEGWGTALKPALEPITVARKPISEKTVAANVLKYGTGGINIDESRVGTEPPAPRNAPKKKMNGGKFHSGAEAETEMSHYNPTQGRFPANLIHDGSEEVTELFPNTKAGGTIKQHKRPKANVYGDYNEALDFSSYGDDGSAARFFYVPKTTKKDRNDGLDAFQAKATASSEFRPNHAEKAEQGEDGNPYGRWKPEKNNHPTVKPTDLMRYLVTMVTPKGGTTLDPFMGSGSTGRGAKLGGFNFVGIELDPEYFVLAKARIDAIMKESTLEDFFSD